MSAGTLCAVQDVSVDYRVQVSPWAPARTLRAVREVSFELQAGETLGIVGESGCGKSTLVSVIAGLREPSAGKVFWRGADMSAQGAAQRRARRREIGLVFQDPAGSLDPRMRVAALVAEPLTLVGATRAEQERRVAAMLERVGLAGELGARFPHELSGGQCQRVAIARALVNDPSLLICDEPVSALDVSVQAQIVNLLRDLQRERGLAMLFVSHNLAVVRQVSARVLVMYLGREVELAARDELFATPRHPYTRELLAAAKMYT
ncbi:MAG TPA: ATP-binding cassette domain-containing protein [Steroidobacteraceae bacterium]|nr:ATP-binding cassette domain-containing protein [Steroidobacteraceae bacterium]